MIKGYLRAQVEEKGREERLQTKEKVKGSSQVNQRKRKGVRSRRWKRETRDAFG